MDNTQRCTFKRVGGVGNDPVFPALSDVWVCMPDILDKSTFHLQRHRPKSQVKKSSIEHYGEGLT